MMNNKTINITLSMPKHVVDDLKEHTKNLSKYVSEAIVEKRARERRDKALQEILAYPPTFTDVEDSVAYIRTLRSLDNQRLEELYGRSK
jgi:predicted nucleic acid-binding protein